MIVLLFTGVLAASVSIPAQATGTAEEARQWSSQLWRAAIEGDQKAVDTYLTKLPDGLEDAVTQRFSQRLTLHQDHLESSVTKRNEIRDEAEQELRENLKANEITKGLGDAAKLQYYSESFDVALKNPSVVEVIGKADAMVAPALEDRDWLLAQELLYRLKALYEDTGNSRIFESYKKQLEMVNHRVMLLANYAPRRLYELRQQQVTRRGDEPLPEFNPKRLDPWDERLADISAPLLKQSLRRAQLDHIDHRGLRPLLEGGLDAVSNLATVTQLAENEEFASLKDAEKVQAWQDTVDELSAKLTNTPDSKLRGMTDYVLHGLLRANDKSINVPSKAILREFGDGAMNRLDQYSEIIWPDKLRRFRQATEGNFIGVGIVIRHNDRHEIMVVNPLEGTPAHRAGVKPDDIIVGVDGDSTLGWSLNDAVDRITGKRGTRVKLGLKRESEEEQVEVTIARDIIKLHSVSGWWKKGLDESSDPIWDWMIDPVSRIAYVRLSQFSEDTFDDLISAWNEASQNGRINGLILDLRFNPGGLLPAALAISNLFIPNGELVSVENQFGESENTWKADAMRAPLADVPTVVLVNKGSASASEIVAGCIQAHRQGVIIGERSYGKGSVQTVHRISFNSRLKLTTQYYRLPPVDGKPGRLVHKKPGADDWGVMPDIEVKMTPEQISKSLDLRQTADLITNDPEQVAARPDVNELITEGLDPQLETALLLLQARVLGMSTVDTEQVRMN